MVAADLKQKLSKCELFKTWIAYLGHIVSKDDTETDLKKIATVKQWFQPTTVPDVHSCQGFTNHYKQCIHQYVQIARTINSLIAGKNASKKKKIVGWPLNVNSHLLSSRNYVAPDWDYIYWKD